MLYLIPSSLSEENVQCIPQETIQIINSLSIFFVEDLRTARRFLRKINPQFNIDGSSFYLLNEHEKELETVQQLFKQGMSIGLLSDAGCPAVADPGKDLIALAHKHNVSVKPLVGPNSILLALMASGFNGQSFSFEGYLPNKQPALDNKIKDLELQSRKENKTILFIETPYRNNKLLEKLIQKLQATTWLCVAANLTGSNEKIVSQEVKDWKKTELDFDKQPAVFIIYAG